MERSLKIKHWLTQRLGEQNFEIVPASADASFRRYFRITAPHSPTRWILMDAPPTQESCEQWLAIHALLEKGDVPVPQVFYSDITHGFILMADGGDQTYLRQLNNDTAPALYQAAFDCLLKLQRISAPELPRYDVERLRQELDLFPEWYLTRHRGLELNDTLRTALDDVFTRLLTVHQTEGQVLVHRDYHSRNLMYRGVHSAPMLLDFQDAVIGPISYDPVSLLKDAYISWDEAQVLDWLIRYWQQARAAALPVPPDFTEFYRNFEWMGVQRHLKVLGIFARLYHRDQKADYLPHIPRLLADLRRTARRYGELQPLITILQHSDPEILDNGLTFAP